MREIIAGLGIGAVLSGLVPGLAVGLAEWACSVLPTCVTVTFGLAVLCGAFAWCWNWLGEAERTAEEEGR